MPSQSTALLALPAGPGRAAPPAPSALLALSALPALPALRALPAPPAPTCMMRNGQMISRRDLLRAVGRAALLGAAAPSSATRLLAAETTSPLFEEVPASASGITWIHDNARSPQRFLPESLGPGCAFLDYDNDGWMDLFLVNSGPAN